MLISNIYKNPNNAHCAHDVTASTQANKKLKKRAFMAAPLSPTARKTLFDAAQRAIAKLREITPERDLSVETTIQILKSADNIIYQQIKSLRKRKPASVQGK